MSTSHRAWWGFATFARLSLAAFTFMAAASAPAATIVKANNTSLLSSGASWVGGVAPGTNDVARWDSTVSSAGNVALGTNALGVGWSGVQVVNPALAILIPASSGATLTLGAAGIDLGQATVGFTNVAGLVLGADQTWTVTNGRTLMAAGAIAGSATLTKAGAGTLILSGNNAAFSGTLNLAGGTVTANAAGLGNATGAILASGNATLTPSAVVLLASNRQVFVNSGATLAINPTAANALTIAGVLGGDGTLALTGAGTLTLTGANTNGGSIVASAGVLQADDGVGLSAGAAGANVLLTNGLWETAAAITRPVGTGAGAVQLPGGTSGFSALGSPVMINFGGATDTVTWGTASFAPATLVLNAATADRPLTLQNGLNLNGAAARAIQVNASSAELSGAIGNTLAGGLTKTGAGTLILTGANSFTGLVTVSAGVLRADDGQGLPTNAAISVAAGVWETGQAITRTLGTLMGQLNVGAGNSGFSAYGAPVTITLNGGAGLTWAAGNFAPTTSLVLNGANADSKLTLPNAINFGAAVRTVQVVTNTAELSGALSGSGGLTKTGAGTLLLSGTNAWSAGATTVSAGTLQLATTNALPPGALTVQTGAILDLQGYDQAIGALTFNQGTILGTGALTGTGYTVGTGNTSGTIAARLRGAGVPLTKVGTGTIVLTGSNDYSGTLEVDNGVLTVTQLGDARNGAGNIRLGTGAASGELEYAGDADVTLTTNRLVELFSAAAGGGKLTVSGAGTLTIQGDLQVFNTGGRALTLQGVSTNANTFAGSIANGSGTISLVKAGSGTWVLAGTNDYSGTTTISGGILQIGAGGTSGTLGAGATTVTAPGVLSFNRSDAYAYAPIISGTGGITLDGGGTVTLSGVNVYDGGTLIHAGTLRCGAANVLPPAAADGNVSVGAAGTLDLSGFNESPAGLAGAGTVDNTVAAAGTNVLSVGLNTQSTSFSGVIQNTAGTLALTKLGTGTLTLSGANRYSGDTTITAGTLQLGAAPTLPHGPGKGNLTVVTGAGHLLDLNGFDAIVNGLAGAGAVDNTASNACKLTLGDNNATSLFSGVIKNTGGVLAVTKVGTGVQTLSGANTYDGDTTISNGTLKVGLATALPGTATDGNVVIADVGTLDLNGLSPTIGGLVGEGVVTNTANAASTLTLGTNGQSYIFSGTINNGGGAGTVALTKLGAGILVLAGPNAYSGLTTVSAGTLQVGAGISGGLIGSGNTVDNATLIFERSNTNLTYAGIISGSGTVEQAGFGTLILTGANTYAGGTMVSAGTLQIGAGGATGALGPGPTTNNAALAFNRFDAVTYAGAISGSGTLTQLGGGTLTLTGANTYLGGTTISAGTLQLGSAGAIGSIVGDITNNATLAFNRTDAALALDGIISGSGAVTKLAAGTVTLMGLNTFSGTLWVQNGLLSVTHLGDAINGSGAIKLGATTTAGQLQYAGATAVVAARPVDLAGTTGGGTLSADGAGSLTFTTDFTATGAGAKTLTLQGSTAITNEIAGAIVNSSAATSVIKAGNNTWILSGANAYTGATTVNGGTLQIGAGGSSGSIAGASIVNNAALVFNRGDTSTYAGVISGSGPVQKLGAGTLVLTGANTDTNVTTVSGGAVQLGNGGATGAIAGDLLDNASVIFNRSDIPVYAGAISGSGALTQLGSGTVSLTGTNTYHGGTTISAGTLQLGNAGASGSIVGDITNNATLSFNRTDTGLVLDGAITGTGAVTKVSTGTVTLTGLNTFSGTLWVQNGLLSVTNFGDASNGTGPIKLGAGGFAGQLQYVGTNAVATARAVDLSGTTGGGILASDGAGSLTFTTDFTASGAGNKTLTLQGGNIGTNLIAGAIGNSSGTTSLIKTGAGTWVLDGPNTYTGATTVNGGILQVGAGGASGSVAGASIVNTATLVFNRSDTYTYAGVISGAGGNVLQNGVGTLILAGANTCTGPTVINAGTLQIGAASERINNSSALQVNGGTLDIQTFNETVGSVTLASGSIVGTSGTLTGSVYNVQSGSIGARLGGTNGLIKTTGGTVTLTSACTYTGSTIINAGTLLVSNASGSGTGTGDVTVNGGGVLGGTGTIAGTVTPVGGGIVAPGDGLGTLTVGSLAFGPGSVGAFEFGPGATNDQIVVQNADGLLVNGGGLYCYATGTTNTWSGNGIYRIIQFTGAIGGVGLPALNVLNRTPGKDYFFTTIGNWVVLIISSLGTPEVTTADGASGIGAHAAQLNGFLVSTGGVATSATLYWGTADGGTNPAAWLYTNAFGQRGVGEFHVNTPLPWLQSSQTYFYRCYAVNANGSDWSDWTTNFTTLAESTNTESPADGDLHDASSEYGPSPDVVFVNYSVGYVFYSDGPPAAGGNVTYRKTIDGGATWGAPVSLGDDQNGGSVAVWYDRWTPGDNTGTKIRIAHIGALRAELMYNELDTSNDSFLGAWTSIRDGTVWTTGASPACSITKSTSGRLFVYAGGTFGTATNIAYYSDDGAAWTNADLIGGGTGVDAGQLLPLSGGDVLLIQQQATGARFRTAIWTNSLAAWSPWHNEDAVTLNANYDATWGATLNRVTGDIFVAGHKYPANAAGSLDVYKFAATNRLWNRVATVASDAAAQITTATLLIDDTYGDLYAAYGRQSGAAIGANPTNVYIQVRHSGDAGLTWSAETTISSQTNRDIRIVRGNLMNSERLYAVWFDEDNDALFGNTVADLSPTRLRVSSGGYTNVTPHTALVSGTLESTGESPATVWVYWGTTNAGTDRAAWQHGQSLGTPGTGTVVAGLGALVHYTNYYYRFYAINAQGEVWADTTPFFRTPLDINLLRGTNYLGLNMDFEITSGPGLGWVHGGDSWAIVGGQTCDGSLMFTFTGSDGVDCETYQMIDVSKFRDAIAESNVTFEASIGVNYVSTVARNFHYWVTFYDASGSALGTTRVDVSIDDDASTWERVYLPSGLVPPTTTRVEYHFRTESGAPWSGYDIDCAEFILVVPGLPPPPTGIIIEVK